MELDGKAIGERVLMERRRRGWSLRTLGQLAGISHSNIDDLEKGKRLPTLKAVQKIATALDMPVERLIGIGSLSGALSSSARGKSLALDTISVNLMRIADLNPDTITHIEAIIADIAENEERKTREGERVRRAQRRTPKQARPPDSEA